MKKHRSARTRTSRLCITYAQRIQQATLPAHQQKARTFRARSSSTSRADIVSGDFYRFRCWRRLSLYCADLPALLPPCVSATLRGLSGKPTTLSASFFSIATVTRSMIATYIVALVVLMAYLLTTTYFARKGVRRYRGGAGSLRHVRASGVRRRIARRASAIRCSRPSSVFSGQNRILWVGVAVRAARGHVADLQEPVELGNQGSKRTADEKASEHARLLEAHCRGRRRTRSLPRLGTALSR